MQKNRLFWASCRNITGQEPGAPGFSCRANFGVREEILVFRRNIHLCPLVGPKTQVFSKINFDGTPHCIFSTKSNEVKNFPAPTIIEHPLPSSYSIKVTNTKDKYKQKQTQTHSQIQRHLAHIICVFLTESNAVKKLPAPTLIIEPPSTASFL